MSYCRFGSPPSSDAYIFACVSGFLECCGCCLAEVRTHGFMTTSRTAMIAHVEEHLAAGSYVPASVVKRLRREIKEVGDAVA